MTDTRYAAAQRTKIREAISKAALARARMALAAGDPEEALRILHGAQERLEHVR